LGLSVFILSIFALAHEKRNMLRVIIETELMLFGLSLAFISTSIFNLSLFGQIIALFILAVAACESVIGLGLMVVCFRRYGSVDLKIFKTLNG